MIIISYLSCKDIRTSFQLSQPRRREDKKNVQSYTNVMDYS